MCAGILVTSHTICNCRNTSLLFQLRTTTAHCHVTGTVALCSEQAGLPHHPFSFLHPDSSWPWAPDRTQENFFPRWVKIQSRHIPAGSKLSPPLLSLLDALEGQAKLCEEKGAGEVGDKGRCQTLVAGGRSGENFQLALQLLPLPSSSTSEKVRLIGKLVRFST